MKKARKKVGLWSPYIRSPSSPLTLSEWRGWAIMAGNTGSGASLQRRASAFWVFGARRMLFTA